MLSRVEHTMLSKVNETILKLVGHDFDHRRYTCVIWATSDALPILDKWEEVGFKQVRYYRWLLEFWIHERIYVNILTRETGEGVKVGVEVYERIGDEVGSLVKSEVIELPDEDSDELTDDEKLESYLSNL